MDGWLDGWLDGWVDGWEDECIASGINNSYGCHKTPVAIP